MKIKIKRIFDVPGAWRTGGKVKQEKPYLPLRQESKISDWVDERNKMPSKIIFESETDGIDVWYYASMQFTNYKIGKYGRAVKIPPITREVVVNINDAVKIFKILSKCEQVKGTK